jgi:signal peptidase I
MAAFALVLSLVIPGTGQAYYGAWRRGLAIFAALLGLHVIGGFLAATFVGLVIALCAYAGFHLLAAFDALRCARGYAPATKIGGRVFLFFIAGLAVLQLLPFGALAGTELYELPENSNQPTLRPGDVVMSARFGPARLDRGDIIVFTVPNTTAYVKRVVGLPGDRIQLRGGILYVNGSPVPRRPIERPAGAQEGGSYYEETLPGASAHAIREVSDSEFGDDTKEYVVPDRHVFVMGDNRDNSQDSRFMGPIAYDRVLGRAAYLLTEDLDRLGQRL